MSLEPQTQYSFVFLNPPVSCVFLPRDSIFKWSISAAITSWKDFRTTAPTYFFVGNPFPIDLQVFGYSIGRLHDPNVARADRKLAVIQWKSMKNQ